MRPAPSDQKVVNGRTVLIYNERNIDDLLFDEVFDPDNPESGNIFPSLYSRIMKKDGSLWYVNRQDKDKYKSYFAPCRIPNESEMGGVSDTVQVISYGNDEFYLYIDDKTKPFGLRPDAKLIFFGNDITEYILTRSLADGTTEVVSMYFDSTGNFVSNRIPMVKESIGGNTGLRPTNCHTTLNLSEGETVQLLVFDSKGNQASKQTLFVRNTLSLNDLNSLAIPILGMGFTSPQMRNSEECYIYEKQDVSHLNIQPYLTYADGTRVAINIDNQKCFLLGADDYIPAYPGYSQTVVLKYFLNRKESALSPEMVNEVRFITKDIKIITVLNTEAYSVKIGVFPVWRAKSNMWMLRWFAYTADRDHVYDVTDKVEISQLTPFNGGVDAFGKEQAIEIKYNLSDLFSVSDDVLGVQNFWITVWNPNAYVKYTFREDAEGKLVYGADSAISRRPIIHYDKDLDRYFIPTSVFHNWEAVVESFYYNSNPPYNPSEETKAPEPTHFNIRDIDNGQMLISSPIPGATYDQAWAITFGATKLSGRNVIVEFLYNDINGDGSYEIIFGVPVDVVDGTYNTELNRLSHAK